MEKKQGSVKSNKKKSSGKQNPIEDFIKVIESDEYI